MASAQVVETSVTNNSPSQDSYHPDDLFQSRYATPGFKPFSYIHALYNIPWWQDDNDDIDDDDYNREMDLTHAWNDDDESDNDDDDCSREIDVTFA